MATITPEVGRQVALDRIRRMLSVFPRRPQRRYDVISEAMAKPFGGGGGQGPTRDGGVTGDATDPQEP
jgi:hypothetical protein